ncbi:MAG TPA: RNA polymerase sigma-70 factor [Chitinophagaceae bacterium]|jgi:RNA polymerase sigma-70 factor (ECF subfamily)|nr:RNA polymerase sigma-70 factor [Chitinophagaceae bacterium]
MSITYAQYDDAYLLQLMADDDDRAFTEIYNRYWDRLFYVAGIKCRDTALAEEIVQDIFLDLWSRRSSLQVTSSLSNYLAVSVKYRIINAQAKLKRARDYQALAGVPAGDTDNQTQQWLSFHELQERLEKLVKDLPEKCRIAYKLSRDAGLSQKEIAARMSVSEKAVEANISRAMKTLRLGLKHYLSGFLPFL